MKCDTQDLKDHVCEEISWISDPGTGKIDVRLQIQENGSFTIHTGDACFDIDHSGFWGAGTMGFPRSPEDTIDLATKLVDQALDHKAQFELPE